MSLESLLLVAVFFLLPLIQRMLQARRESAPRVPQQAGAPPLPAPPPRAPRDDPYEDPYAEPFGTTFDETLDKADEAEEAAQEAADAAATEGGASSPGATAAPDDVAVPVTRAPAFRPSPPRRAAAAGLRSGPDLRRAIALTTILGPCRAVSPYEPPDHAARP